MTHRSLLLRSDIVLLLVAAALVLLYTASTDGGFPLDDSWIHQTYARSLGTTGVWAFVPDVPSAASTSPLYTVLLAAGYALGVPLMLWTHGLGALALGLTGIAGRWLASMLAPDRPRLAFVVGLALVLNWHLIWAAASGMETALFSLWTLVLIGLAVSWAQPTALEDNTEKQGEAHRAPTQRQFGIGGGVFGIVAALATLTRPEGLLLAGLCGLVVAVARLREPTRLLAWALAAGVGFGVVSLPNALYNLSLTGGLLPDTAAAKQTEFAPLLAMPYIERVGRMLFPLMAGVLPLLVPGMVAYFVQLARGKRRTVEIMAALLPLLWAGGLVALYAARLPANYHHGRYAIPAIPALVVVGVVGTAWLLHMARRSLVGRVGTRVLALSAVVVCLVFALVLGVGAYRQDVRLINEEIVAAAQWIATHIPADDLLAVHDIGAVGYFAPRPLLDLAGLVSPEVVPYMGDAEALWALMQAREARYLMAFPDQIPGQDSSDARLCLVYGTGGTTAQVLGVANMAVYQIAWDGNCSRGV